MVTPQCQVLDLDQLHPRPIRESGPRQDIAQLSSLIGDGSTPVLVMDLARVRESYRRIRGSVPDLQVYYAVKANDAPEISETLAAEGAGFEIASLAELRMLQRLGVPASRIMCLHPIKSLELITELESCGVRRIAIDSLDELEKVAALAPRARPLVRITVSNEGSAWPLSHKFGVPPAQALELLRAADARGLKPCGLTFHVGSQCLNPETWQGAIETCASVWKQARREGIGLEILSLGGGVPANHAPIVPSPESVGGAIDEALCDTGLCRHHGVTVTIEPGRGIVGNAGTLVASVIGTAVRETGRWAYLDVGTFHGLMETIDGISYKVVTLTGGPTERVTLAGPTCDSVDVPFREVQLPHLRTGDRVFIMNAGAYTAAYATDFNGFPRPGTICLDSTAGVEPRNGRVH